MIRCRSRVSCVTMRGRRTAVKGKIPQCVSLVVKAFVRNVPSNGSSSSPLKQLLSLRNCQFSSVLISCKTLRRTSRPRAVEDSAGAVRTRGRCRRGGSERRRVPDGRVHVVRRERPFVG